MNVGGNFPPPRLAAEEYRKELENQISEKRRRRKSEIASKIGAPGEIEKEKASLDTTHTQTSPVQPLLPPYGSDHDSKARFREQERAYRSFGIFDPPPPAGLLQPSLAPPPLRQPAPTIDDLFPPPPQVPTGVYTKQSVGFGTSNFDDTIFHSRETALRSTYPYRPNNNPWDFTPSVFDNPPPMQASTFSRRDEVYEQRRQEHFARRNADLNQSWPRPSHFDRDPYMSTSSLAYRSFADDQNQTRAFPNPIIARSLDTDDFRSTMRAYAPPPWLQHPSSLPPPPDPLPPPPPDPLQQTWPPPSYSTNRTLERETPFLSQTQPIGSLPVKKSEVDFAEDDQKKKYFRDLEVQVKEKEERKKKEQLAEKKKQLKEDREMMEYNPWGRPGAGAPMRDPRTGRVLTKLNELHSKGETNESLTLSGSGDVSSSLPSDNKQGSQVSFALPGPTGGSISEQFQPANHSIGENRTRKRLEAMDPFAREDMMRRQRQQQELQDDLRRQIEEKERAKRAQFESEKAAEAAEEDRLRREREQLKLTAETESSEQQKKKKTAAAQLQQQKEAPPPPPLQPPQRRGRRAQLEDGPSQTAATPEPEKRVDVHQSAAPSQPPPPPLQQSDHPGTVTVQLDPRLAHQTLEALEQVKRELKEEQSYLRSLLEAEQKQLHEAIAKHDRTAISRHDELRTAVAVRERALEDKERELQVLRARVQALENFSRAGRPLLDRSFMTEIEPDRLSSADLLYEKSVARLGALQDLELFLEKGDKKEVERMLHQFLMKREEDLRRELERVRLDQQSKLQADSTWIR